MFLFNNFLSAQTYKKSTTVGTSNGNTKCTFNLEYSSSGCGQKREVSCPKTKFKKNKKKFVPVTAKNVNLDAAEDAKITVDLLITKTKKKKKWVISTIVTKCKVGKSTARVDTFRRDTLLRK